MAFIFSSSSGPWGFRLLSSLTWTVASLSSVCSVAPFPEPRCCSLSYPWFFTTPMAFSIKCIPKPWNPDAHLSPPSGPTLPLCLPVSHTLAPSQWWAAHSFLPCIFLPHASLLAGMPSFGSSACPKGPHFKGKHQRYLLQEISRKPLLMFSVGQALCRVLKIQQWEWHRPHLQGAHSPTGSQERDTGTEEQRYSKGWDKNIVYL